MSSKLEEQQIEALEKVKEFREILEDLEINGIDNPYGLRLLEQGELETKEKLDRAFKIMAKEILSARYEEHKKTIDSLFEGNQS